MVLGAPQAGYDVVSEKHNGGQFKEVYEPYHTRMSLVYKDRFNMTGSFFKSAYDQSTEEGWIHASADMDVKFGSSITLVNELLGLIAGDVVFVGFTVLIVGVGKWSYVLME